MKRALPQLGSGRVFYEAGFKERYFAAFFAASPRKNKLQP